MEWHHGDRGLFWRFDQPLRRQRQNGGPYGLPLDSCSLVTSLSRLNGKTILPPESYN
jgi:hypothetical protein